MKVFLFLYPIKEYIEFALEGRYLAERGRDPRRLNKIIDYRYRQRGYQVVWLLFSDPEKLQNPDLKRVSDIVQIYPQDLTIVSGTPFAEGKQWKYPKLRYIFSQIPGQIEDLVVGGFHQQDCVDRIAGFAYREGIPTWVDEDTTEFFFATTAIHGNIPLRRRGPDTYSELIQHGQEWVERVRKVRKNKPWLDQIHGPT